MEPVKASDVIANIRKKVAEDPERKYDTQFRSTGFDACVYQFADGTLGCLVGQCLIPLMEDKEFFRKNPDFNSSEVTELFEVEIIDGTEIEVLWLETLQVEQDRGESWGECLNTADEKYPLS